MTVSFVTAQWAYDNLPYQFPLIENMPAPVRLPIAGPEPFNTLVIVRARGYVGPGGWASGHLNPAHYVVATDFWLAGNNDQRLVPVAAHSTTAMLSSTQASPQADVFQDAATAFVWSINTVDAEFMWAGGGWQWQITLDTSNLVDQVFAAALCYVSSWVLCQEPAPDPGYPTQDGHDLRSSIFHRFDPSRDGRPPELLGPHGPAPGHFPSGRRTRRQAAHEEA